MSLILLLLLRLEPTNKMLAHEENFIIKHYAGDVVYTITGKLRRWRGLHYCRLTTPVTWSTLSQVNYAGKVVYTITGKLRR